MIAQVTISVTVWKNTNKLNADRGSQLLILYSTKEKSMKMYIIILYILYINMLNNINK